MFFLWIAAVRVGVIMPTIQIKINHKISVIFIVTRIWKIFFLSLVSKWEVKLNRDHNKFLILNSKNQEQYLFGGFKTTPFNRNYEYCHFRRKVQFFKKNQVFCHFTWKISHFYPSLIMFQSCLNPVFANKSLKSPVMTNK